ncbi:MAG TPA: NAD(P)/FAD-dependent oxidoreductase [Levilinea sp.]|nr:NAD(P)/FAD-dependent oxidoreductase [Levilinea sp.]
MIESEVIIVGGGPAGSACAWRLRQQKINCIVLDQALFPRFKPCAGWITPDVLRDLEFDLPDYPHGLTPFTQFDITMYGFHFILPTKQYSIRRYEFDDWLLRRSGAPVYAHRVQEIRHDRGVYFIDNQFCAPYLVGAGGTHCPVFHTLFKPHLANPRKSLIVAQEEEFRYEGLDDRCRLWFFENKLPGYSWYVPKKDGYLNVGVGGSAGQLKSNGDTLKNHWNLLVNKLADLGLVRDHPYKPVGHSYYLRERSSEVSRGNAFLVGDALGLATKDMGEGIGPAVQSGLLAAKAIARGGEYSVDHIPRYSFPSLLRFRR